MNNLLFKFNRVYEIVNAKIYNSMNNLATASIDI